MPEYIGNQRVHRCPDCGDKGIVSIVDPRFLAKLLEDYERAYWKTCVIPCGCSAGDKWRQGTPYSSGKKFDMRRCGNFDHRKHFVTTEWHGVTAMVDDVKRTLLAALEEMQAGRPMPTPPNAPSAALVAYRNKQTRASDFREEQQEAEVEHNESQGDLF